MDLEARRLASQGESLAGKRIAALPRLIPIRRRLHLATLLTATYYCRPTVRSAMRVGSVAFLCVFGLEQFSLMYFTAAAQPPHLGSNHSTMKKPIDRHP